MDMNTHPSATGSGRASQNCICWRLCSNRKCFPKLVVMQVKRCFQNCYSNCGNTYMHEFYVGLSQRVVTSSNCNSLNLFSMVFPCTFLSFLKSLFFHKNFGHYRISDCRLIRAKFIVSRTSRINLEFLFFSNNAMKCSQHKFPSYYFFSWI